MNFSPYTRILLRYGLGYFVAKGLLPDELVSLLTTDPEFIEIINLAAAAAVAGMIEGWYVLAKRLGWAT